MIRINLLGRARPKAPRKAVPLESTLQIVFIAASLVVAGGVLYYHWHSMQDESAAIRVHIQKQTGEKARLTQLKNQVDQFEHQKGVLQQRINVIEELQRDRTGGQQLLDALGNTVGRTDTLWLTSLTRKDNALTMLGTAGSINSVANFITQLKHSGYFDQVEIKSSEQDPKSGALQMFTFSLTAQFAPPQDQSGGADGTDGPSGAAPASTPAPAAKKGL